MSRQPLWTLIPADRAAAAYAADPLFARFQAAADAAPGAPGKAWQGPGGLAVLLPLAKAAALLAGAAATGQPGAFAEGTAGDTVLVLGAETTPDGLRDLVEHHLPTKLPAFVVGVPGAGWKTLVARYGDLAARRTEVRLRADAGQPASVVEVAALDTERLETVRELSRRPKRLPEGGPGNLASREEWFRKRSGPG